ncbi:uncharacterized protein LOC116387061 isoform X2 [Anarrhichthys ocellatus]|uniref:uncharacterized protein LOC116387061 isoform X2 n=1 Tax=Anarrhichthys ocellatus TaxID=433405 RepID=UPI0012EDF0E9|nr:uncharacterized protein LOC116387061 isoform X2 [Anarrhichthys ocellatus]
MDRISLGCQVCLSTFCKVCHLKRHMSSRAHQQKCTDVFKQDIYKGSGNFPFIALVRQRAKQEIRQPLTGLTLCFSRETDKFFYLCHLCEEKCPSGRILSHLTSIDHCRNYSSHTNPNVLRFSWIPSNNVKDILRPQVGHGVKESSGGQLQLLDLPGNLLKKHETSSYSEVMRTLSENETLLKLLEAIKPKRVMMQTYQRDSNREHPLLGMQHLVECICVGQTEKRHYLCTLCQLTLAAHAIIKHVLSFDHVFCYFRAWHPHTLLAKESYKAYSPVFGSTMLNLAKQTEQIHGTANADMKQVSLEPTKFTSVNFTCYADALKELESIRKENNESSLITSVTPGNKLGLPSELYKLRCQNCSMSFMNMSDYCKHSSKDTHKKMVKKIFRGVAEHSDQPEWKPSLGLYKSLIESLGQNQPLVGVPLVVTCVCTRVQKEPIYVCFACQDCFTDSLLRQHFDSQKHVIHTLLYLNPWRLTLAWENRLDVKVLRSMAWEEEKEKPDEMMLKVLDMPNEMFQGLLTCSYSKVMESLALQHIILKHDIPKCETYSKLEDNDRFPLLGRQFLVMHDFSVAGQQPMVGFLCLLCKRRLSDDECYAHEFSRKHIATFIDNFHPGSLNSNTDEETFLDLAKVAARYHSISNVQVIKLNKPIREPCTYYIALNILTSANMRERKANLDPPIHPGMKLVPRQKLKDVEKAHVRDDGQKNSRMMEERLETTSQKSTDNSETTLKETVEVGAEVPDARCLKSGENAERGNDKETPTSSEKESEKRREAFSKMSSEEKKQSETRQAIKEKIEKPTASKPSGDATENCQNTDENKIGKERSKSRKGVLTLKREISQMDTCPVEDVGQEIKKQRLTFKGAPQNLPSSGQKEVTTPDKASFKVDQQQADQLWQYVKRKSREPVVGLGALLECSCDEHDPIYLCECCSLKIPEKDIISHVTGVDHQKTYLVGVQKLPPPPGMHQGKTIRQFAALFEQENGYGEAQVVELDDAIYNNISKQDFDSAIQTVKELQDQQNCGHELPSTSALSGVQPVDSSVTLNAQHEVCFMKDNFQVVKMETDDSEDSEAQSSSVTTSMSVMTETTSNASKVPTESNEAHIKASKSPDLSLSEDKAEIISNTTVGPLKIATTSKEVGRSETAATSDSTVTTTISKFTTKSSNSTPDTTTSTAPISKLKAANNKSRETANKCTATIPICTATTSTSSATVSRTTSTKTSATLPKTLESRTGAAADVRAASYKAATHSKTESTVGCETACRTAPGFKTENASKSSESASKTVVASQTMGRSVASAKMTDSQTSVSCENTGASVKTAHVKSSVKSTADVAPNIPKSKAPASLHLTMPQNPPAEPSQICTSEKRPSVSSPEVGLNQLIKVSCGQRKQVYCRLCSVRLLKSDHTCSADHQLNYVKIKDPKWTCKESELESKLHEMVTHLAVVERNVGTPSFPTVKVTIDVYKELADLSPEKALERLKAMLARGLGASSPSTASPVEVLRQQVSGASPLEASSPDDEIESSSKESFDRSQSVESSEPEADDQILDQLHSILNKNEPVANPRIQDAGVAAKMQKPQTPDGCKETPEWRPQQERSRPEIQDTWKVLEGSQKTSPVQFFNPEQLSSAATVNTEQQNQPRHSQKAEPVSRHSDALPRISIGESAEGSSNLSSYLKVTGHDRKPIIGMGFVWECRFVSEGPGPNRSAFYLCESCSVKLRCVDICQHMISDEHQFNVIMSQQPELLYFWPESYVLHPPDVYLEYWMKLEILNGIAQKLSIGERRYKTDAQSILLGLELYESVWTASFSEALEMVKKIKREQKLSVSFKTICTPQRKEQLPEGQHSPEESLSMEMQPAQALETDRRSDNGPGQTTEIHRFQETVGDLDGVKPRRVLSPLGVTSVSSKADSVVSPCSGAATCVGHQEQPGPRPPVSQHQRPIAGLPVKQAEVHSESTSTSVVCPQTTQTLSVFSRDPCPPAQKRPAVESIETLIRSSTNNPNLKDPLPDKCKRTYNELQPIFQPSPQSVSESTSVNPAATSLPLSLQDKDTGPGSDEQDLPIVDQMTFDHLMALYRERKSEINVSPCTSAPGNGETTTCCANSLSESGVQRRRWDQRFMQTTSKMAMNNTYALEKFNSFLDSSTSARGDLLFGATKAKAVGTTLPYASTADPSDPQHQRSIGAQTTFGNTSQSNPSPINGAVINSNPGHILQPPGNTENNSTWAHQLPINAIVTVRSKQFIGGNNEEDITEVNRGNVVTHSLSSVAEISPSDTSERYGQYNQMAYVTNGQSSYFSSEAVGSCSTPGNPPVHTGSSFHSEGYPTRGLYFASRIHPEQETTRQSLQSFATNSLAPQLPPEWVMLRLQQQQLFLQQQQLFLQQQQQLIQQQLIQQRSSSWTSTSMAAGNGNTTNEAAYVGTMSFTTPANISQNSFYDYDYRLALTQSSNNITQNNPQVYHNPPGIYYPPAANTQVMSQAYANSFFASGGGFSTVAPSMINSSPP